MSCFFLSASESKDLVPPPPEHDEKKEEVDMDVNGELSSFQFNLSGEIGT